MNGEDLLSHGSGRAMKRVRKASKPASGGWNRVKLTGQWGIGIRGRLLMVAWYSSISCRTSR
jgi:hypothetical protein